MSDHAGEGGRPLLTVEQARDQVLAAIPGPTPAETVPLRDALKPLDRDDEFIFYGTLFGWGSGAPDFHPRLQGFCNLDRSLADDRVNDLIDQIQGKKDPDIPDLAKRMTQSFIGLYQRAIQAYKDLISADPPPPPGEIAAMQSQIDQLQKKIGTLNQFLQTL
jgi:hypothetical protein